MHRSCDEEEVSWLGAQKGAEGRLEMLKGCEDFGIEVETKRESREVKSSQRMILDVCIFYPRMPNPF